VDGQIPESAHLNPLPLDFVFFVNSAAPWYTPKPRAISRRLGARTGEFPLSVRAHLCFHDFKRAERLATTYLAGERRGTYQHEFNGRYFFLE
jgi:hypothetical protein